MNRADRHLCPAIAFSLLVVTATAHGKDAEETLDNKVAGFFSDLSVPASPAAVLAGFTADKVIQPRTRREWEVAVSGLFKDGTRPAAAVEFAPYFIAAGGDLNFKDYQSSPWLRALTKTSLGVASGTKEVDGNKFAAEAISLSVVLFDFGDPIYHQSFMSCASRAQVEETARVKKILAGREAGARNEAGPLPSPGSVTELSKEDEITTPEFALAYKKCTETFRADTWNRTKVAGGAFYGRGNEETTPKRDIKLGQTYWITAQYGFEPFSTMFRGAHPSYACKEVNNEGTRCSTDARREPSKLERFGSLLLHVRRTINYSDLSQTTSDPLISLDSSLAGVRFIYGDDDKAAHLEYARSRISGGGTTKSSALYGYGVSLKWRDDLWVNLAGGRRKDFLNDRLDTVVALNVQFGASAKALFPPAR